MGLRCLAWPHNSFSVKLALLALCSYPVIAQGLGASSAVADHPTNVVLEITAKPRAVQEIKPQAPGSRPEIFLPWKGLLTITVRNVSQKVVPVDETTWIREYLIDVEDAAGNPVAPTERGKRVIKMRSIPKEEIEVPGWATRIRLAPGQEFSAKVDLSQIFQVHPGVAYKIKIRRSLGFPAVGDDGKGLVQRELSCTVVIDALGVLQ